MSTRQREATYNIISRISGEFVVSASTHKLDIRRDQRDLSLALPLAARRPRSHATRMFVVSEAEAAAIRAAFERGGELSAAVELRRLFRGITSTAQASRAPPKTPSRTDTDFDSLLLSEGGDLVGTAARDV